MPKAIRTLPPAEYLHQCFEYDAESGVLRWKRRPREHFKTAWAHRVWNGRFAGQITGRPTPKGYLQVTLDYCKLYNSRIIYKMHHGIDPEWMDHKDRDRSNNALANLRSASMRQNNRNMLKRTGKAGFVGVHERDAHWRRKRFIAVIRDQNGKKQNLGLFSTAEEAHAAYRKAAAAIFGEFSPFHD
jgi:hypothetical protein